MKLLRATLITIILPGVVICLVLAMFPPVLGERSNRDGTYGKKPYRVASAKIDDIEINLTLNLVNPILLEHEILVSIDNEGKTLGKTRFVDSGGLSSVFVLRDKTDLVIRHGTGESIRVDLTTKECREERSPFQATDKASRIGKFRFGQFKDGKPPYRFDFCTDDDAWLPKTK